MIDKTTRTESSRSENRLQELIEVPLKIQVSEDGSLFILQASQIDFRVLRVPNRHR